MTSDEVRDRLGAIRANASPWFGDGQKHAAEDELYRDVLQSIAEGTCEDPAETARLALTSDEIEFSRWYE